VESVALAVVVLVMGGALLGFGRAVGTRRIDLVFGDMTAETTVESGWKLAHEQAGRGFQRLGALLVCAAPFVVIGGVVLGGWVFGGAMVSLVVGVFVVAGRAYSLVADNQIAR